jgi:hypothetical protein
MFHTPSHHIHLPRAQRDRLVATLDIEGSFEHEEEVIRVVVLVPDEGTAQFGHHNVVAVELGDGPRREIVGKLGKLIGQSHLLRHVAAPAGILLYGSLSTLVQAAMQSTNRCHRHGTRRESIEYGEEVSGAKQKAPLAGC